MTFLYISCFEQNVLQSTKFASKAEHRLSAEISLLEQATKSLKPFLRPLVLHIFNSLQNL